MFWYIAAIFVGMLVLSFALMPKPQAQKKPGIGEIKGPTADENRSIQVIFGTVDIDSPNCAWWGDVRTKAIKKAGGKKG